MEHINVLIKDTIYVLATPNRWAEEGELPFTIKLCSYDTSEMSHCDDTLLYSFEIEHEVDGDFDLRGKQVDKLEAEKLRLIAEHTRAVIRLDEKINSLLAIEHDS